MINVLTSLNIIKSNNCVNSRSAEILLKNVDVKEKIYIQTNFLPTDSTLRERIYCIQHNISSRLKCKCGESRKFIGANGYRIYCSNKCPFQKKENVKKIKQTNLKKYGHTNYLASEQGKQKSKQTKLERYGNENYNNQEKGKQTCIERYGDENYRNVEQVNKTCLKKYGVKRCISLEVYKEKRRKNNLKKYNRADPGQRHISHGTLDKLNDKEWLIEQHYDKKKTLIEIAEMLNVSDVMIGRYLHEHKLETKYYHKGSYNKQYFETYPDAKYNNAHLYIIHCYNETESFIKIGITQQSISIRNRELPYEYNILLDLELPLYITFKAEQDILNQFKEHSYQPNIEFGGQYECLNEDCLEDIIQYLQ